MLGALAVAGGAAFVDWSPGERFAVPLAEARARVAAIRFDQGILRDTASAPVARTDAAGEHLRWDFSWQPGKAASWCEATLAAAGAKATRLVLECGVADRSDPLVARRGGELLQLVAHEHVAAALEDRAFDQGKMGMALMMFAAMHQRELAQHQLQRAGMQR